MRNSLRNYRTVAALLLVMAPGLAAAATAAVIDLKVDETIKLFQKDVNGADVFLNGAAGYLVFPRVIKIGLGFGAVLCLLYPQLLHLRYLPRLRK